jgi:lysophospholipase L1-like esterase
MSSSQTLLHLWSWQREKAKAEREKAIAEGKPDLDAGEMVSRVGRDEYVENIRTMVDRVRSVGAEVLVIGAVYGDPKHDPGQANRMREYRQALATAMHGDGIPYLEIPELTAPAGKLDLALFGEPIHPNTDGHIRLADRILEFIADHQMLKGWNVPPPAALKK